MILNERAGRSVGPEPLNPAQKSRTRLRPAPDRAGGPREPWSSLGLDEELVDAAGWYAVPRTVDGVAQLRRRGRTSTMNDADLRHLGAKTVLTVTVDEEHEPEGEDSTSLHRRRTSRSSRGPRARNRSRAVVFGRRALQLRANPGKPCRTGGMTDTTSRPRRSPRVGRCCARRTCIVLGLNPVPMMLEVGAAKSGERDRVS